jgi:hypothetical protein
LKKQAGKEFIPGRMKKLILSGKTNKIPGLLVMVLIFVIVMLIHVYKLKSNIMAQTDIYQQITNQLIEILETHKNLDYTCNWTPSEVMAKNVVTGRNYKGL